MHDSVNVPYFIVQISQNFVFFPVRWPSVRFLVFIDGRQSKRSYVVLGVLILNIYMLLDVSNSGRVCTLAPMLC